MKYECRILTRLSNWSKVNQKWIIKHHDRIFNILSFVIQHSLGLSPYPNQLYAALCMFKQQMVEMGTGEGKTLSVAITALLFWLAGIEQIFIITSNDYLAKRDYNFMSKLLNSLHITKAYISPSVSSKNYNNNIIYTTLSTLGFDFMKNCQGGMPMYPINLNCIILDEADLFLVVMYDTPMVMSNSTPLNLNSKLAILSAYEGVRHFELDKRFILNKTIYYIPPKVYKRILQRLIRFNIYSYEIFIHACMYVQSAFYAKYFLIKNQHYVLYEDKVLLVNEQTGRMMNKVRLSGVLHHMLEVKERVKLGPSSNIVSHVLYQSLFRSFKVRSGISGTIVDDVRLYYELYGMKSVKVPDTNKSYLWTLPDRLYDQDQSLLDSMMNDIRYQKLWNPKRPILIITQTITESFNVSYRLSQLNIKHDLLNALTEELESKLIKQGGLPYKVLVSTVIAGRGSDIVLGGGWRHWLRVTVLRRKPSRKNRHVARLAQKLCARELNQLGGVFLLIWNRSKYQKVNRQIQGRTARHGNLGSVRFYVSKQADIRHYRFSWVSQLLGWGYNLLTGRPSHSIAVKGTVFEKINQDNVLMYTKTFYPLMIYNLKVHKYKWELKNICDRCSKNTCSWVDFRMREYTSTVNQVCQDYQIQVMLWKLPTFMKSQEFLPLYSFIYDNVRNIESWFTKIKLVLYVLYRRYPSIYLLM